MKRIATVLSLVGALGVGIAGGVYLGSLGLGTVVPAAAQGASATTDTSPSSVEPPTLTTPAEGTAETFATPEVNSSGQTFGVVSPDGLEAFLADGEGLPDLILVVGDAGKEGYVERAVLVPDQETLPDSPKDAVAYTLEQQRTISTFPVYASDGVTQVDTFTLTPTKS
jgi:hypothetical protein